MPPTEAEFKRLFLSMPKDDQLEVFKRLLADRVRNSPCWDQCNFAAVRRVLKLVSKRK